MLRKVYLKYHATYFRMVTMENLGHLDHHGKVRGKDIEDVVSRLSYSDWLILYYLAQVIMLLFRGRIWNTRRNKLHV